MNAPLETASEAAATLHGRRSALVDAVVATADAVAPPDLRALMEPAIRSFDAPEVDLLAEVLREITDLDQRTVRDVMGRDGEVVAVHHYPACRREDAESSWDHRTAYPTARRLRGALLDGLLAGDGVDVQGIEGVRAANDAGKRLLFIANHESIFDLAVLPHALAAAGLGELADRLTMFVNPKIFNMPFVNLFICKPTGLIKVPQSPRIAANESVMGTDEILRRAGHAFNVARQRLAAGDSLVIYPEGLRSEGLLHRFARAYLDLLRPDSLAMAGLAADDVLLVPWAHRGVRTLEGAAPGSAGVSLRFGAPVSPTPLLEVVAKHSAGVAGHVAGFLVARLLPERQRGVYGQAPGDYLDHPHFRLRIRQHTLDEIGVARGLSERL